MNASVAVIGGGYGGIAVAAALDDVADVRLIEARDTFVHNVALLRAVADPEWVDRLFLPYDALLTHGSVHHGRAAGIVDRGVELASGEVVPADYVVVATGSSHAWPAKVDTDDAATAKAKLLATHRELARADRVLLLGAGAVGLELAGEIKAAWPDTSVVIVDPSPELLSGRFPRALTDELDAQLDRLGIERHLGTALERQPPSPPGQAGAFTATTTSGASITADIWFACHGAAANSDVVAARHGGAVRADGRVSVTPQLQVVGHDRLFAIGDVTAVPEMKMAHVAQSHAAVVAANIRALVEGSGELTGHDPAADAIILPIGPAGGASYAPEWGVLGAEQTAGIKGGHLFVDFYREQLGLVAVG